MNKWCIYNWSYDSSKLMMIDAVFFSKDMSYADVKRALIEKDGYPPTVVICRG